MSLSNENDFCNNCRDDEYSLVGDRPVCRACPFLENSQTCLSLDPDLMTVTGNSPILDSFHSVSSLSHKKKVKGNFYVLPSIHCPTAMVPCDRKGCAEQVCLLVSDFDN